MSHKSKGLKFADSGYDIKITGRHVEISDAMKAYALEKVSKFEHFMDRIIDVNIIMDIQKRMHQVEIILSVGRLKITSKASSTDMYASIDKAVAKLESQLLRYKSKMQDHHAKGHSILNMQVDVIEKPLEEEFDFEDKNNFSSPSDASFNAVPRVVKQETIPLKTLTLDQAIMKMELMEASEDSFMLFKNEADQKLRVIYRRKDGNYGIIEPNC